MNINIEEIKQIPLLKAIDLDALKECFSNRQILIRHYHKGTTVHHQHESCTALDVVLSGSLVAYSLSENGSAMNLFEFHKNSIIGAKSAIC
jgi:CRP-like cAMP-binding protein